jgi:U2 small nuclear ribonucleoprotein A'
MRLSAEVFAAAEQRQNPVGERELVLRGLSIPAIEHLQITRDAFDAIDFTDNRIVRIDNFPRMLRLSNLMLSGNVVESIDPANLRKNVPNVNTLILSHNRVSTLHEVANIGEACPKLEFLCLRDNPVTRK